MGVDYTFQPNVGKEPRGPLKSKNEGDFLQRVNEDLDKRKARK